MWVETLERMGQMGMNLVSTYVPWDYHEPEEGRFEFADVAAAINDKLVRRHPHVFADTTFASEAE